MSVTSASRRRTMRFLSRSGVLGSFQSRGKSLARAAIRARCCSSTAARSCFRCCSYCYCASVNVRSFSFQSASSESATRRLANRLVAAELERRWNEKLERVSQLEHAYTRSESEAQWDLTAEERKAIAELSQDLPAIWSADTTTNQERKQLLRMAIESVQLDGISQAGQVEGQIRWRSGAITSLSVKRSAPGEGSLKTPAEA